jgi:hypothetical protein
VKAVEGKGIPFYVMSVLALHAASLPLLPPLTILCQSNVPKLAALVGTPKLIALLSFFSHAL